MAVTKKRRKRETERGPAVKLNRAESAVFEKPSEGKETPKETEKKATKAPKSDKAKKPTKKDSAKKTKEPSTVRILEESKSQTVEELNIETEVVFEETKNTSFNLPISILRLLRKTVGKFKEEHDTKGPDRNHLIIVALKRLMVDLEGEDREQIIEELLDLRLETIAKQYSRRK